MKYVATFFTHLSAAITCRTLKKNGITASLSPVPRSLSSSCGTCVRYTADDPQQELMDKDVESIAVTNEDGTYTVLVKHQ